MEVADDEDVVAWDPKMTERKAGVASLSMSVRARADATSSFHSDPSDDEEASFYTCDGAAEVDYQDDVD